MALFDWIFVLFGAAVALCGSWVQLHPERVVPPAQPQSPDWQPDAEALLQIRLLGACFVFMGTFFALQMAIILTRLPWWIGALGGLVAAIVAVASVRSRVQRQKRRGPGPVRQIPLPKKVLELR
jgi:hypothetical protein